MSVTTVLVPVLPPEAEALLAGTETPQLVPRATRLRARVAVIDPLREELHALLFPLWERVLASAPDYRGTFFTRLWRKPEPPRVPATYDPYVHVFGRSFPVVADSSKAVVERTIQLLKAEDDAFLEGVAHDLRAPDARAPELLKRAPQADADVGRALMEETAKIEQALRVNPPNVRDAYDAVVRISAWSWPVWRLDGVMLRELTATLGITVPLDRASSLFEILEDDRPELATVVSSLPKGLENFAGGGGFWSSTDVKLVAGSLRLYRSKLARNAVENGEDPTATLRQLRLLEEAVFFCEAQGLALAEAAGVEWHDRPPPSA